MDGMGGPECYCFSKTPNSKLTTTLTSHNNTQKIFVMTKLMDTLAHETRPRPWCNSKLPGTGFLLKYLHFNLDALI